MVYSRELFSVSLMRKEFSCPRDASLATYRYSDDRPLPIIEKRSNVKVASMDRLIAQKNPWLKMKPLMLEFPIWGIRNPVERSSSLIG